MDREPWKIDLHHHILPDYYLKALADRGIGDAGGAAFHAWSPEIQLAAMDAEIEQSGDQIKGAFTCDKLSAIKPGGTKELKVNVKGTYNVGP